MDYRTLTGDFQVTAYGVRVTVDSPRRYEYALCGLGVYAGDGNYELSVAGYRDMQVNTIETKATLNYRSRARDTGSQTYTESVDMRVRREGGGPLLFEYSLGNEEWRPLIYDMPRVGFDDEVRVGVMSYGFSYPRPFTCTIEAVVVQE